MYKSEDKKKWRIILSIFMVVLLVAMSLFLYYYKDSVKPISSQNNENIKLEIPNGSSSKKIGKILEENNLIKSKWVFLLKVKLSDNKESLKAGSYDLSQSMNLNEIINSLKNGGRSGDTIKFTIPEGYEIKDIAEKLDSEGIIDKDKFLILTSDKENFEGDFTFLKDLDKGQSLEGFLFPSTYEIYASQGEKEIINKMLEAFEKVYRENIEPNLKNTDLDLNEIITLASIVEREAKLDIERATISGVFHNRLKIDMNLQSCATVQYILGERKEVLSTEETKIDSPFNTYVNNGLPPSPIASPGEASLLAAINPEDVDYLFFRVTGKDDGSHTFSKTFEEHKNAKPKK